MIPFDETDAEWNELCNEWIGYLLRKFKERGIYDQVLELCDCEQEAIQLSEPIIDFEELYEQA